ncbi:MAG: integrating conjugative element protein [Legionellales bacterium]|nr:integrating conjugative element protein [Legionellales bacterium]
MGLLNNIIKSWRFLLGFWVVAFLVVLVSFPTILLAKPASTAVIANGAHATHLIRDYLKAHPADIEAVEQTQDDTIVALDQLQQLSNETLAEKIAKTQPKNAVLPKVFPVRSPALTPGKVMSKPIHVTLPQPIFIVGDDAMSKAWLRQYQQRLAKLRAKGYVVNVSSKEAMQALTAAFSHLSLMAIPGDSIAKNLGLKHYPALISNNLIEQ